MEELRLENYMSMPEHDLKTYEYETIITYVSFPIYQVHKIDPMLFVLTQVHLIRV